MKKLFLIFVICLIAFTTLGNKSCNKKPKNPGDIIPNVGIPLEKFCGVLTDFKVTPKGSKVSSCGATIPTQFLETVDDACEARQAAIEVYYPDWNQHSCDVLLLEPDGVLTTIENYPRDYLVVGGITTAGTVMFGNTRSVVVLPHYQQTNWANRHFQFYANYHEEEHRSGFLNQLKNPLNDWRNYLGANDVHPQKPYIEKSLPDYAKSFPSLTDQNLDEGLKKADPIILTNEQSKEFFDRLDAAQSEFK